MKIDRKQVPVDLFHRSQWIQTQLRMRGTNLSRLAKDHGLGSTTLHSALRIPSLPAEQLIANALGTTPKVLFPERYSVNGERLHQVRSKRPPRRRAAIGLNAGAA